MLLARVFIPFALGYFVSYVYRNVNAVIFRDLASDLGLAAAALGLLTSAYFFAFSLVQIPLGLALDRFGPRRVDAALLVLAAIGALAFSWGTSVEHLVLARTLIGLGVSAALMSSMKAFVMWVPMERLASTNGWLLAVGGVGAMAASVPVELALGVTDWRGIFRALAAITIVVAAIVFFVVPERAASGPRAVESLGEQLRGLGLVLRSRAFWRIAGVTMTSLGPAVAIQGLWVAPWMRDLLGIDREAASGWLLAFTAAMTVGFLVSGLAADRLARFGLHPVRLFVGASVIGTACLAFLATGVTTGALAVWAAYNFFTTTATLGFVILSRHFPPHLAGRVATSLNMMSFVAAFAVQYGFGAILDRFGTREGGYSAAGYGTALGVLVVAQVVALAFLVLDRRAHASEPRPAA